MLPPGELEGLEDELEGLEEGLEELELGVPPVLGLMLILMFPAGELGKVPVLVSISHIPVSCFLGQHLILFGCEGQ